MTRINIHLPPIPYSDEFIVVFMDKWWEKYPKAYQRFWYATAVDYLMMIRFRRAYPDKYWEVVQLTTEEME